MAGGDSHRLIPRNGGIQRRKTRERHSLAAFAVALALINEVLRRLGAYRHLAYALPVTIFVGAFTGFIWTILVALLLGPWFGAFSVPVLYCWVGGGVVGSVFTIGDVAESPKKRSMRVIVTLLIIILASLAIDPLRSALTREHRLHIGFGKLQDGGHTLNIVRGDAAEKCSFSMQELEETGLTGQLVVSPGVLRDKGRNNSYVIIIARQQIRATVFR